MILVQDGATSILDNNLFCFFLFQITPSAEIIRTTHLPQFRGAYFVLKNQYKIILNIEKKFFFIVYDVNKNKKIETIVLYFFIKKKSSNKLPKRDRT